jgi:uncharacterized membrane protein
MKKTILISLILLLAAATNVSSLDIRLYSEDKTSFSGFPAIISVDDIKFNTFVDSNNEIIIEETSGILTVQVLAGNIYTGHDILKASTKELLLKPTAKITGHVKDVRDNLLQDTQLKITCSPTTPTNLPSKTDDTGFFEIQELNFGTCDIKAIKNGKITSYSLDVNESREYDFSIVIQDTKEINFGLIIALILAIFVALIMYVFSSRGKTKVKKILSKDQTKYGADSDNDINKKELSKRQNDIMATLSEREKTIINQLFLHGTLAQSQLRYKTSLPKSSLHRTLTSLQQKNIIILKEDSGIKKISLTEFFKK